MAAAAFQPPEIFSFPPFFTIQPNDTLREKQLDEWKNLILGWHQFHSKTVMDVPKFPLFENKTINRKLSDADRTAVMDHLVSSGHGEWVAGSRVRCSIFATSPDQWAQRIYDYVASSALFNRPLSIYILREGEMTEGAPFHGLDARTMLRALEVLQRQRRGKLEKEEGDSIEDYSFTFAERS